MKRAQAEQALAASPQLHARADNRRQIGARRQIADEFFGDSHRPRF